MTLVVDASVVLAALLDEGETGAWAAGVLRGEAVVPDVMLVEVTRALRRAVLDGSVTDAAGSALVATAWTIPASVVPFATLAPRVWELRRTVSVADAAYVAVAERLGVPLATADRRLARASGPRCEFLVPPGS
ncbi:type II toxin-antitoxin system VapC family toxin [Aquipuribacter nitratireducens]|uniref:Ribonuclease VapC n=1 Tax=Aquipuribacter nitratireducens TaxID=650104 RepID=A0ABW0GUL9_9MICO